ncbi:MAG: hypothetical protein A3F75_13595 [Betaproteobacteria bacterium RIFCSPLOWO2_12_FULL_64_23]|nr:MAG: hypothetical protein A3F75_13595 [Betaproteobacteria bacterium RIFCSPLOWO2_12_FULL_64_23]
MISLFGGKKPNHPMADIKEARKLLEELPTSDAFKCADELTHWLESVMAEEGFKPEYRAQLIQLLDETAQIHLRKLARDYMASPRLAKFQEIKLWKSTYEYWRQAALAYVSCIDLYAAGAKGADTLKGSMPLLLARALRALAAQVKWMYVRYGPMDQSVWGVIAKVYALAENRKFAQSQVTLYPGIPSESTPEQEFLKVVMLSASSPDSLLPLEVELCERLIAHFCASFTLRLDLQPDIAYWIDLATSQAPLRLARPPQHAPTLRFFAAGRALEDLENLIETIKTTGNVPAQVNLGGSYPAESVLDVLNHLALYWSPKPPARKHQRHRVKSRLNVIYGYDGVLGALGGSADPDTTTAETWIVENVSAGGFGAGIPEIKGDWLKIGCLLGLQPEGGDNWVLGVVRRIQREISQKGLVGIQTISKSAQVVQLRVSGGAGRETGILIGDGSESPGETRVLLRFGVFVPGQNMEYQKNGASCLLMPQQVIASGEEYEMVRFREMVRDTSSDE